MNKKAGLAQIKMFLFRRMCLFETVDLSSPVLLFV